MSVPPSLLVDAQRCTACRSCELACHYHHTGRFGTTRSSVHVQYEADSSGLSITFDRTCNECPDEDVPLCAQFCGPGAIQLCHEVAGRQVGGQSVEQEGRIGHE